MEDKNAPPIKEKVEEDTAERLDNQNSDKVDFAKPDSKEQKPSPPTKKDIMVRKLKYQLK